MIIYQLRTFLTCFSDKFMRIKKIFQYGGQYKTHINAVKTKLKVFCLVTVVDINKQINKLIQI